MRNRKCYKKEKINNEDLRYRLKFESMRQLRKKFAMVRYIMRVEEIRMSTRALERIEKERRLARRLQTRWKIYRLGEKTRYCWK